MSSEELDKRLQAGPVTGLLMTRKIPEGFLVDLIDPAQVWEPESNGVLDEPDGLYICVRHTTAAYYNPQFVLDNAGAEELYKRLGIFLEKRI